LDNSNRGFVKNSDPIKWQDAAYFEDPKSDFHYTGCSGFIGTPTLFNNQTINNLHDHIDNAKIFKNKNELNYCQLELYKNIKCIYFECGIC